MREDACPPLEVPLFVLLALQLLAADSTRALVVAPAETLTVVQSGPASGPPVVLVPSLFASAYAFRDLAPALAAEGHRVVIVEPLGMGTSSRPRGADYSLTAQGRRLAAALDSLGVRRALVVGHSVGGAIGFRLAVERPELVTGLLSIEGGPAERAASKGLRSALEYAPWIKAFGGIRVIRSQVRKSMQKSSGDAAWVTDSLVAEYTEGMGRNIDGTLRAFLAMADAKEPQKIAPQLGRITCPVLLMLGTAKHDGAPAADEVAALRTHVRDVRVELVPGAGHHIHEEQLAVVVAAIGDLARAPNAGGDRTPVAPVPSRTP